jgi:cupin fold WbuC family metalloprotein
MSKLPPVSHIDIADDTMVRVEETTRAVGLFCRRSPSMVDAATIAALKQFAARYPKKNVRLCLHASPDAPFHSMVIHERKGTFYPPHRHARKGENWHIVEGRMAVFIFDADGRVTDARRLGGADGLIYQLDPGVYHTVVALSDTVIYHETKLGPFLGAADSLIPGWSPDPSDSEAVRGFVTGLLTLLDAPADAG